MRIATPAAYAGGVATLRAPAAGGWIQPGRAQHPGRLRRQPEGVRLRPAGSVFTRRRHPTTATGSGGRLSARNARIMSTSRRPDSNRVRGRPRPLPRSCSLQITPICRDFMRLDWGVLRGAAWRCVTGASEFTDLVVHASSVEAPDAPAGIHDHLLRRATLIRILLCETAVRSGAGTSRRRGRPASRRPARCGLPRSGTRRTIRAGRTDARPRVRSCAPSAERRADASASSRRAPMASGRAAGTRVRESLSGSRPHAIPRGPGPAERADERCVIGLSSSAVPPGSRARRRAARRP